MNTTYRIHIQQPPTPASPTSQPINQVANLFTVSPGLGSYSVLGRRDYHRCRLHAIHPLSAPPNPQIRPCVPTHIPISCFGSPVLWQPTYPSPTHAGSPVLWLPTYPSATHALLMLFTVVAMSHARGGHRQKRARREAEGDEAVSVPDHNLWASPLAAGLVLRWSEGKLSAKDVQELAALAVASGATDMEVRWLATINAHGSPGGGGNASKQLVRTYCARMDICEPHVARIACKCTKTSKAMEADVCMFLPHDLLGSLGKHYPDAFASLFGTQNLSTWWSSLDRNNPKAWQHPIWDMSDEERGRCIPLQMFGDGVEFQDRDSLNTVAFKGVCLEETGAKDAYLLMAAFPKCCSTEDTWPQLWTWIAWSLRALLHGKHPRVDPWGVPFPAGSRRREMAGLDIIPGGYTAVLWAFCADLDYFSKELGMPYHSCREFCWRCRCNRSTRPWNDFRPEAAHRRTLLSARELAEADLDHTLFKADIGFGLPMLQIDAMHAIDLGVSLYTIASVLSTVIYKDMVMDDKEACFAHLWTRIQEISKEIGIAVPLTRMALKNVVADTRSPHSAYPCLRFVKVSLPHTSPQINSAKPVLWQSVSWILAAC